MNDVYVICDLTKQAHHQAVEREKTWTKKAESYIALMHGVRELHPGMGLRTMHEMVQPEGIGRDSFIALGLTAGFRLQTVSNPTRTTFSTPLDVIRTFCGVLSLRTSTKFGRAT